MATIYKRGKYYWVAYKDRNGRRIQKTTKLSDKTAATVIKKHYDAVEKSYQLMGTPLQRAIRCNDWYAEYIRFREHRLSKKTLENDHVAYNSLLLSLSRSGSDSSYGNKYLNEIKETDLEDWYNYLLKNRATATANCYFRHIKTFFNAAVKKEYIYKSPCANIKQKKETIDKIKTLTPDEVQIILKKMPPEWQALSKTALYTGARAGELCRLKKKDIDFDLNTVTIHSQITNPTKSKKFRVVPLPAVSITFFKDLIHSHNKTCLLVNPKQQPWQVDWISHGFSKYPKSAGFDYTFHDLRKTYGAWLIMNGADLVTVQENLGHSDIKVTRDHYIHLMMDHKKKQVDKLPEI